MTMATRVPRRHVAGYLDLVRAWSRCVGLTDDDAFLISQSDDLGDAVTILFEDGALATPDEGETRMQVRKLTGGYHDPIEISTPAARDSVPQLFRRLADWMEDNGVGWTSGVVISTDPDTQEDVLVAHFA